MHSLRKSSSDSELNILNPTYQDLACRRQRSHSAKAYLLEDLFRRGQPEYEECNSAIRPLQVDSLIDSPVPIRQKESPQNKKETVTSSEDGNLKKETKSVEIHQDIAVDICSNDVDQVDGKASGSTSECKTGHLQAEELIEPTTKIKTVEISDIQSHLEVITQIAVKNGVEEIEESKNSKLSKASESSISQEKEVPLIKGDNHSSHGDLNADISSPYQILEESCNPCDLVVSGEIIFGQPRCLTLKQCDANPRNSKEKGQKSYDFDDIFSEHENEVGETLVSNLSSKQENDEDIIILDREEGELTPDLQSTTHSDRSESKRMNSKETSPNDPNAEFLSKINQCFLNLEDEFREMRVSEDSSGLKGHLLSTLRIVDRMKRKITLLIDSSNAMDEKGIRKSKHTAASGDRQDSKNNLKSNPSTIKTKSQHSIHRNANERQEFRDSGKNSHSRREINDKMGQPVSKYDGRDSKDMKSHASKTSASNPNPEAPNLKRHDREKVKGFSQAGGRKEQQRMQSLFKRQMNLITQHVVRKKEVDRYQQLKSWSFEGSSKSNNELSLKLDAGDASQKVPELEELKTLDDMENFLNMLKEKQYIKCSGKKGVLDFTTKKSKRIISKPIVEKKQDEKKICPQIIHPKPQEDLLHQNENGSIKMDEEGENAKNVLRKKKEPNEENSRSEKVVEYKLNQALNVDETSTMDSSKNRKSKGGNIKRKEEKISEVAEEHLDQRIELLQIEENASMEDVIDSVSVKRKSKKVERIKPSSRPEDSDFEDEPVKMVLKNSKKQKRREYSRSASSDSDRNAHFEIKDHTSSKKRKRNDPSCKLSLSKPEEDTASKRKSTAEYQSEKEIDFFSEDQNNNRFRSSGEIKPQEMLIVANETTSALLNKLFRFKVVGNQIFLQTTEETRSSKCNRSRERKNSNFKTREWNVSVNPERKKRRKRIDRSETRFDATNAETTLKEMEDFLQELRANKDMSRGETPHEVKTPNPQTQEVKFMARIHAKRKAKLMACMSETSIMTEKEAKFLKDLEKKAIEPEASPTTERRKQKLMKKIRAETDTIILSQKKQFRKTLSDDDPLQDVKTILNLIREAESENAENDKQNYVSFPLKRSDVKKLENISEGRTSALSEESQRFLNNVRAKMRAKKATLPVDCSNQEQENSSKVAPEKKT